MTKKEKVNVTIDSNEASQNPEMTEILVMHKEVEDYKIEPMDEADLRIENCLFERKTPSDFASSLQEGRLRDQVERMGGREEQSFILIEGDMRDFNSLPHTKIPAHSLRGMISSIIARNRIQVVFCSTPEMLADTAVRIARKSKEDPTVQTQTSDSLKEPTFLENLFLGVEGIGGQTAEKLASEFESLRDVSNASIEDFESIDGVGPKTSKKIHNSVHTPNTEETESTQSKSTDEVYSV